LSSEEINKMLEKQRILKKNQTPSVLEYKIIKNTSDMDDIESNTNKKRELQKKEILEIHKEVNNINFDEDDHDTADNEDNIEDLKSAILNTKDES